MSLTPSARSTGMPNSLQLLDDLKKIKVEIEESEVVENMNDTSPVVLGETEYDLGEGEDTHGSSSSSELSEPEDSGCDTALTSVKHEGSHLGIEKPQERSIRTRKVAKTYIEPDSSSEDVGERQKGRGIVVQNTWAVDLSQESDIDSTASYTSDSTDDSVEEKITESDFSTGKGEDGSALEYDSPSEQFDAVHPTKRGKRARRLRSAAGRKKHSESGKISQAKLKYMITHGTLNDVQRKKPWEVIAKECGVTASLEHIFRALKQAGVSYDDRLGLKSKLPQNRDHDTLSVSGSSSPLSSTSSTHDHDFTTIKLTPRELDLIIVAYQSIEGGCKLELNYEKLADLAGFQGSASAKAVWGRVKHKLDADASLSCLTDREGQLLCLAFRSLKDGHIIHMNASKYAKLAGLGTANSARASWSALKKKLVAGPSSVVTALPTTATALKKRKRPAYIMVDDSESEGVMPTPKKGRPSTSTSSPWYHRSSDLHRSRSRKAIDAEKSRQPAASYPFSTSRVETRLPVSTEPLHPEIARNTATTKESTRTPVATIAKDSVRRNNAAVSSNRNNISGRSTTSKTMTKSAIEKNKKIVWNLENEYLLLLAIIEVDGHKMNIEAIAERLGCTGNAVRKHLARLKEEIGSRSSNVPLIKTHTVSWPMVGTKKANPGVAPILEPIVKPNDSTARSSLPNATRTREALFTKNEIAKLEAGLAGDEEAVPWTEQEVNALKKGLRRFSGPFWDDILGLFGPTGSVSDALKNRDEAQLEEKACRMKISYLKSGVNFPFYLRMVTGAGRKAAPVVVVDEGERRTVTRDDEGYGKDIVVITSDEENRP